MDQSLENRIASAPHEMWTAHGRVQRSSRAALACGRTGSVGDIDGRTRRQTKSEEEATVVRTFADRQNGSRGAG